MSGKYNNSSNDNETTNQASKGGESNSRSILRNAEHIQPVQAKPLEVKVYGNFDKASKAFRAIVQKERILSVYKEKQSFEKPSDKKRRKRNESRRKAFENSRANTDKRTKRD